MNILLIGGTGVLGRSFCKLAQHTKFRITALSRNTDKAQQLRRFGVDVRSGSILDEGSIREAIPGHEAVINFASAIPQKLKPSLADWHMNDLLRTRGVENILKALPPGDILYVQAGIAFVYGDHRGAWVDETSEVQPNSFTRSARRMEELFLNFAGQALSGASFRFSIFYHQDAWHTQAMIHELKKRRFPIIGDGQYYWNLIHVDDAASAVLCALENRESIRGREIINISDDEPVLCIDFLNHLAHLLGVHEPTKIPQFIARLALSSEGIDSLTASYRCKTDRIKSLGWKPSFRSFKEGFPSVLQYI